MSAAYTGHQQAHRNSTKEERQECGRLHASAVVKPPDHSQDERNPAWARLAAAKENLMSCFNSWLILEVGMVTGRYFTDSGLRPQENAFNAAAKGYRRLLKWQGEWEAQSPAEKPTEAVKPDIVMLGSTEIEMGEGQYHRPGLVVGHSAQDKRLFVRLYFTGRAGKQKDFHTAYARLRSDHVEIDTGGAVRSKISLAEWQTFIDEIDVRVSDVSRNTIQFTPQLIKMARDVEAFRRQPPKDMEWAAETTGVAPSECCADCGADGPLYQINNSSKRCTACFDAHVHSYTAPTISQAKDGALIYEQIKRAEVDELLEKVVAKFGEIVDVEIKAETTSAWIPQWWWARIDEFGALSKNLISITGGASNAYYPPPPFPQHGPSFLIAKLHYSLALANRSSALLPKKDPEYPARPHIIPNPDSVYVQALNGLSNAHRLVAKEAAIKNRDTDDLVRKSAAAWDEMLHNDASLATETSADVKPAAPAVLPQALQSVSEVVDEIINTNKRDRVWTNHVGNPINDLEIAAMSKAPIDPKKVEELLEAIKVALAEPGNADAQILPGGYFLRRSDTKVFAHLAHPNHPNHITVGMGDEKRMDFISSRSEIRTYMLKAIEGPRPPKHPALQPINNTEEKAA